MEQITDKIHITGLETGSRAPRFCIQSAFPASFWRFFARAILMATSAAGESHCYGYNLLKKAVSSVLEDDGFSLPSKPACKVRKCAVLAAKEPGGSSCIFF